MKTESKKGKENDIESVTSHMGRPVNEDLIMNKGNEKGGCECIKQSLVSTVPFLELSKLKKIKK